MRVCQAHLTGQWMRLYRPVAGKHNTRDNIARVVQNCCFTPSHFLQLIEKDAAWFGPCHISAGSSLEWMLTHEDLQCMDFSCKHCLRMSADVMFTSYGRLFSIPCNHSAIIAIGKFLPIYHAFYIWILESCISPSCIKICWSWTYRESLTYPSRAPFNILY